MKRFLSIILTAAMLMSATPAVFAENNAVDESVIVAEELNIENQEEITEEVAENVTEDVSEEISGEGEENSEEQISLMSGENDISLMAASEESEVEYSYSHYDSSNGYVTETKQGTLEDALSGIRSSGNTGTIKLLKDIEIKDTIGTSSNNTYSTVTLSDIDGNGFKITRASGFTGEMIKLGAYKCTVHNVTLDGQNVAGCDALIVVPVVENSKGTHLILNDATLCNNTNSAIKAESEVECTGVTVESCSSAEGGAVNIYRSSKTSTKSYSFTNCIFKSNKAAAGSAIFMKSVDGSAWFDLSLNGCTLTGNSYVSPVSDESIDEATTHTVVYVGTAANPKDVTHSSCLNLYGDTTFSDNGDTVSDILLDEGFTNLTEYANLKLGTGSSKPKFANKGDKPIRIAVGSYSRRGDVYGFDAVKDKNIINKQSSVVSYPGAFELAPTFGATLSGDHILKENVDYFKIDELRQVSMQYETKNGEITANALTDPDSLKKGFLYKINNAVSIDVSPKFNLRYNNQGYMNEDTAYENQIYTLNVTAAENTTIKSLSVKLNGSTTVLSTGTVTVDGKSATVKITPDIFAKVLAHWSPYCVISIEYDQSVKLTIDPVENGKNASVIATATDGTTVNAGDSKSISSGKVTFACSGDDFGYIEGNDLVFKGTDSAPYISSLAADTAISIHYKHTTTVVNNENGTEEIQYPKLAKKKTTAQYQSQYNKQMVILRPNANYQITGVDVTTASGENVGLSTLYYNQAAKGETDSWISVSDYSRLGDYCLGFYMPDEDVIITPTYKALSKSITIAETQYGTVSTNATDGTATVGSEVTITATPDTNYKLNTLTVTTASGATVTVADNKFTMPSESVTIKAAFAKQQFSVTASPTTNGTIDLLTESPLNWGDSFTINVQADPHYEIDTVTVDGTNVPVDELDGQGDYTFTMPTHDVIVRATFKKIKYTITGAGEHVTFAIPGSDTYDWDDTVKITVTPEQWYTIKSVHADDNTVSIKPVEGEENTYSFTMPKGNITITAIVERPNFSITFDSKGGSAVTAQVVANGDAVKKPEVPVWAGRGFAGWYTDEGYTNKYDFTKPVTENITLYARWFLWGDVNNDGTVDSYDALLIRRCRAGLTDYSLIENRLAGFVNGFETGRNYPDSGDAVSIRRFRAGLINRYKVEDGAAGYEFDLENDTYIPKN